MSWRFSSPPRKKVAERKSVPSGRVDLAVAAESDGPRVIVRLD